MYTSVSTSIETPGPTHSHPPPDTLFRLDMLQWLWLVQEIVGVCLWHEPSLIRLDHVPLVALLLCKGNGILLGIEIHLGSLHEIR